MVSASVVDGILQQSVTESTNSSSKTKGSGSSLGKDDFLQLLVAQMKYQDPLEPTSNTEYVSQYATFSELEQMQNMSNTLELSRASGLVGQTVVVEETDDNGKTNSDMGIVDYVSYENNKAIVWVNGSPWSLDSVKEVADPNYIEAYAMATTLNTAINKLPGVNSISASDKDAVNSIVETYENMNEYQQSFVASETKEIIKNYKEKMQELLKLQSLVDDNNSVSAEGEAAAAETEGAEEA